MRHNLWLGISLAFAFSGGCSQPPHEPAVRKVPKLSAVSPTLDACQIYAPGACRVGCDADVPKKVVDVAPDLSGLSVAGLHGVEIAEVLIDNRGEVKDLCLRHGVREDVDVRALTAIRQWRFEPARLRHSTPPRAVVPIVMTVSLVIAQ